MELISVVSHFAKPTVSGNIFILSNHVICFSFLNLFELTLVMFIFLNTKVFLIHYRISNTLVWLWLMESRRIYLILNIVEHLMHWQVVFIFTNIPIQRIHNVYTRKFNRMKSIRIEFFLVKQTISCQISSIIYWNIWISYFVFLVHKYIQHFRFAFLRCQGK